MIPRLPAIHPVIPAAVRSYPIFSSSLIWLDLKNHSDFYKPSQIKEELKIG
jgi:hypothetical protein